MIKNPIITGVIAVIGEGALTAVYFIKSTLLEGKSRICSVYSTWQAIWITL